ncbi:UNVERIFIED_CONTAM: hypothetical protein FKN15_051726 [Acipenser sinensis]
MTTYHSPQSLSEGVAVVTVVCEAPVEKLQYNSVVGECCDQSDGSIELAQQTCVEWLWEWEREGSKTGAVLPADRARDTEEAAHSSGDEKTPADCREAETLCSQNPSPENAVGRSKRVLKRKLPFAEYGESTGEPPLKVRVRNDYTIVPSDSSALNPPCTSEEEPEARKEPSSRKRRMTEALDNEPPKKRRILICRYEGALHPAGLPDAAVPRSADMKGLSILLGFQMLLFPDPSVENSPDDEDNLYRASAEGSKRKIRAHEDSDNNRVNIAGEASFKDRLIKAIEKKQKVHHNKANGCKMIKHQKKKTSDNTREEEKTKTAAAESVVYERMKRAVDDLINKVADNEDKERMRRAWR